MGFAGLFRGLLLRGGAIISGSWGSGLRGAVADRDGGGNSGSESSSCSASLSPGLPGRDGSSRTCEEGTSVMGGLNFRFREIN